jgi:hypothetical protein
MARLATAGPFFRGATAPGKNPLAPFIIEKWMFMRPNGEVNKNR